MKIETVKTGFEGFPVQYSGKFTYILNRSGIDSQDSMNNSDLEEIGKTVPGYISHSLHPITEDGYCWFGKLEFELEKAKVVVLFPWCQQEEAPANMDRSINVYSDISLPDGPIFNLLSTIAKAYVERDCKNRAASIDCLINNIAENWRTPKTNLSSKLLEGHISDSVFEFVSLYAE